MVRSPARSCWRSLPALMLAAALPAMSQEPSSRAIVSIYRIAPGKQLAFLKWMAARDAVAQAAGVPATQWYVHLDGDSWDYVGIAPYTDDATDDRLDAAARKQGLKVGPQAGLELREMMAVHPPIPSPADHTAPPSWSIAPASPWTERRATTIGHAFNGCGAAGNPARGKSYVAQTSGRRACSCNWNLHSATESPRAGSPVRSDIPGSCPR